MMWTAKRRVLPHPFPTQSTHHNVWNDTLEDIHCGYGSIYQSGSHSEDVSSYWEWEFHKEVSLRYPVLNKTFFTISFDKLIMYTWIFQEVDFFLLCFIYTFFPRNLFCFFQISPQTSIPWIKPMENVWLRPYAMLNTRLLEIYGILERLKHWPISVD